jgi:subtilisin family serine protease
MTLDDIALQLIVTIRKGGAQALQRVLTKLEPYEPKKVVDWTLEDHEGHALIGLYQLRERAPIELVDELNQTDGTQLEWNVELAACAPPNDLLYREQWALRRISAEAAWVCAADLGQPVPVTVAVIDSGIAAGHPDLQGRVDPRSRRIMGSIIDMNIEDEDGHGTYLSGTIAAVTDNAIGVAGVSGPLPVGIMALKFYDPRTPLNAAYAAHAIAYAVQHHADVINGSWHVGMYSKTLFDAVKHASNRGVIFVAAAGNEGTDNDQLPIWPASFPLPNVISVMATRRPLVTPPNVFDDKPGFSNYGRTTVHIGAPGDRIMSTHYYLNPGPPAYRNYTGTSPAAAHVAAAAALVKAFRPAMTPSQIRNHLIASADPSPYLACSARGRLNLERAICRLLPS